MPQCAVQGCKARGVHTFPRDEERKKLWESALDVVARPTSRVCGKHFKEDDYFGKSIYTDCAPMKKFLKKTAVPSQFLFPEVNIVSPYYAVKNNDQFERRRKSEKLLEMLQERINRPSTSAPVVTHNMEGRNGQYYEESPMESQESTSSRNSAPMFSGENLTITKLKQSLPSTNMFRVVSDPSSLTITKVPSGSSKSDSLEQILKKSNSGRADPMESCSLTITKVTNYAKTESSDQTSSNVKDFSVGSLSNNDLSSDASKMDDDSYDSASFYSVNGDSNLNLDNSNPDDVRAFECDECGRAFKRSDHLRKHKTTHSGLKPYECDMCDKKYTQSSSLKIHKLTHSQANRFACNICPRTFTQLSTLNVHKKIHTTSKMYECPTCGKGYNHSANLAVHQRVHAQDFKFFTCDVCGKNFTQKGNLNTHKMIHSNIRPYKCSVCEKEFVQKNNYLLHLKTHEKNSTSGHVVAAPRKPVITKVNPSSIEEAAPESDSENDEEDDTYLDDFVVGTMHVNDTNNTSKTVTSTPEKSSEKINVIVKDAIPKSSRETSVPVTKTIISKPIVKNVASSVPFVCMDCNNKPFTEKCRLSNHKMFRGLSGIDDLELANIVNQQLVAESPSLTVYLSRLLPE